MTPTPQVRRYTWEEIVKGGITLGANLPDTFVGASEHDRLMAQARERERRDEKLLRLAAQTLRVVDPNVADEILAALSPKQEGGE